MAAATKGGGDTKAVVFAKHAAELPVQLQMWVPVEFAEVLESRVAMLKRSTGVKTLEVKASAHGTEASFWIQIVALGTARSAGEIYRRVAALVDEADDVVLSFSVYKPRHQLLLRDSGFAIMSASADHNVRVYVPPHEARDDAITLEGSMSNVAAAFAALQKPLVEFGAAIVEEEVKVPIDKFVKIIGTSGENMPTIKARSGADVEVKDATEGAASVSLIVSGKRDAVLIARLLVERIIGGAELSRAVSDVEESVSLKLSAASLKLDVGSAVAGNAPSSAAISGGSGSRPAGSGKSNRGGGGGGATNAKGKRGGGRGGHHSRDTAKPEGGKKKSRRRGGRKDGP